ncbi:hypothetical protein PMAYCL1PPCAC_27039 [Pristionchus mayeri]|uniref:Potassium channel domain-containing protein n=1 Tax=Pristionchus mayeri TaxID=1317129 RepID=A0AAN5D736_9BILA|nr:hypothetical protein PMAYCL1PPCAC_27039 [Pristionchus mayeri]
MSAISRTVMHKLQFARGIGNREMIRANTLPSLTRAKIGCFARMGIYEENARFMFSCVLIGIYLLFGALIFQTIERPAELQRKQEFRDKYSRFREYFCEGKPPEQCEAMLKEFSKFSAEGYASGMTQDKDRFDFYGSLFFSGTVISTIGFGTSTPVTSLGRVASIIYGFVGCTCCVLFFNLFLERLVTLLTHMLRYFRNRKVARRLARGGPDTKPVTLLVNDAEYGDSQSSCGDTMDHWRPSVYKVFGCLSLISKTLLLISAWIYSYIEGWTFIDSLYFCFTSFATIGFGDIVSHHDDTVQTVISSAFYRPLNFALLALGACCFYSYFNVSSIVVRQFLNWIIKKMDIKMERGGCLKRKPKRYMGLGLRPPKGYDMSSERSSIDCGTEGLLSLREFLGNQQSSMLTLQKQLIKNALRDSCRDDNEKISATRVGPMGILDETFGDPNA